MGLEDRQRSWDKSRKRKEPSIIAQIASLVLLFFFIWGVVQPYLQYQARVAISALKSLSQTAQQANDKAFQKYNEQMQQLREDQVREQYINNYWIDLGSGAFINLGRSRKLGDLTVAVVKIRGDQQEVQVNCRNRSFYSDQIQNWHIPQNQGSVSARIIRASCG